MSRADREAAAEAQRVVGQRSFGRTRSNLGNGNSLDPAGSGTITSLDEQQQGTTQPRGGRRRPRSGDARQTGSVSGLRPRRSTRSSARSGGLLGDNRFGDIPIAMALDEDVEMRTHTTTEDEDVGHTRGDRHAETSSRHGDFIDVLDDSSEPGQPGAPDNPGPVDGPSNPGPNDDPGSLDQGDDYVTPGPRSLEHLTPTDEFATDDGPATYVTPASGIIERAGREYIEQFTCPQSNALTTARIEGSPKRSNKVTLTLTPSTQGKGRPAYTVKMSELGFSNVKFSTLDMISPSDLRSEIQRHGVPGVLIVAPQTPLNPTAGELACIENPQRYPTTHMKLKLHNGSKWTTRSTWLSLVQGGQHIIDTHFENVGQDPPNKPLAAASRASRQEDGERWRVTRDQAPTANRRNRIAQRTPVQTPREPRNRRGAVNPPATTPSTSRRNQARARGENAADEEHEAPQDVCAPAPTALAAD